MKGLLLVVVLAVNAQAVEWSAGAGPSFVQNDVDLSRKGRETTDGWTGSVRLMFLPRLDLWHGLGLGLEGSGQGYNSGERVSGTVSTHGGAIWSGRFLVRVEPWHGNVRPYAIIAPGVARTAAYSGEAQFCWAWSLGVAYGKRWFVAPEYRETRTRLDPRAYSVRELMTREAVLFVGVRL